MISTKASAFLLVLGLFHSAALSSAQEKKLPPPAPVPPQIATAKKVFISNTGGESFAQVTKQTAFSGGPDRPFDQFYAAMKDWGRYELVSSPGDADLIFVFAWTTNGLGQEDPSFGKLSLRIRDPKTDVILWSLMEYVRGAALLGNRDKNLNLAMDTLVTRFKKIVEAPAKPAEHALK